jgi:DNA-binding HxlR family transcriptional regulator
VTITFKSKLELHLDILHDLAVHGSLQISNLKDKTKIDGSTLKKRLELLVHNNLVEKRPINKAQVLYAITERGSTLLNWFSKLNDALKLEAYAPT